MKRLIALALFSSLAITHAAILNFDLSPAGTDTAVGLSPLNETPPVLNSSGSGNVVGSGITFDTDTLQLNLSIGYGSSAGFTNLTGAVTGSHIHGPAPTNTPAAIVIDLASLNAFASNPADGGTIVGTVVLTTNQAADLLAGLYYINLHTATNASGEIRGQLIPSSPLPTLLCPDPVVVECAGTEGTLVVLTAEVAAPNGDALTVVWNVNGLDVQTNAVSAGSTNFTSVSFPGLFSEGTNTVTITVTDTAGGTATCTTTVAVVDTIPPVISALSATPNVLWPPNHKFVGISFTIVASDLCSENVSSRIVAITSNEPVTGKGDVKSPDWVITGDLSAKLRAERLGRGTGRIYTITVEAQDQAGNSSSTNVTVTVPHDRRAHSNAHVTPPVQHSNQGNGHQNGNSGSNGHGNNK